MCGCFLRAHHWGPSPATQACALTGDRTGDPLVHRLALNPLSNTSQGKRFTFYSCSPYPFLLPITIYFKNSFFFPLNDIHTYYIHTYTHMYLDPSLLFLDKC